MVKAQFPIGKTQWKKWNDDQRTAFNEVRAAGLTFDEAVEYVNGGGLVGDSVEPKPAPAPKAASQAAPKKKSGLLDALEDTLEGLKKVEDAVETVANVAAAVNPMVSVAKTVVKATQGKKGK